MVGVSIRYPAPLRPGDRIAVTSPSAGVGTRMRPRLNFCIQHLRDLGYDVVVGECMDGSGVTSAPAPARAAELTAMLVDPAIRAVVPPWGGELAIDLLPLLGLDAISAAEPTWLVGYSDLTTVMVPLTLRTGIATLHGSNLMDTPYAVPQPGRWKLLGTQDRAQCPCSTTSTSDTSRRSWQSSTVHWPLSSSHKRPPPSSNASSKELSRRASLWH